MYINSKIIKIAILHRCDVLWKTIGQLYRIIDLLLLPMEDDSLQSP